MMTNVFYGDLTVDDEEEQPEQGEQPDQDGQA